MRRRAFSRWGCEEESAARYEAAIGQWRNRRLWYQACELRLDPGCGCDYRYSKSTILLSTQARLSGLVRQGKSEATRLPYVVGQSCCPDQLRGSQSSWTSSELLRARWHAGTVDGGMSRVPAAVEPRLRSVDGQQQAGDAITKALSIRGHRLASTVLYDETRDVGVGWAVSLYGNAAKITHGRPPTEAAAARPRLGRFQAAHLCSTCILWLN